MRKTSIQTYDSEKKSKGKKYCNKFFKRETKHNSGSLRNSNVKHWGDGQANKSAGRMPWHWEPTKDAVSCEKLRGMASTY